MTDSAAVRQQIRDWRESRSRRLVVLDDDPTGSQSVHDVQIVTVVSEAEITRALTDRGSTAFVLTNTRGLQEAEAIELNKQVVTSALAVHGDGVDIISRSDSTLRGHVIAEIEAIDECRAGIVGRHVDGVLFAPAFFEAGRFTVGDTHYATVDGVPVPVGKSEFARDATFGYASSNLGDFLGELSHGRVPPEDVLSISLETITEGGPDAVRDVLMRASGAAWIVINATSYEHYETVVLGVQAAIDAGRTFLFRTGPSFVRALAGLEPKDPLSTADFPQLGSTDAHGLILVGSHVSQTSRQVAAVRLSGGLAEFELNVPLILAGDRSYIPAAAASVRAALANHDVLVYTSREVIGGESAAASLDIARTVSNAVSEVVAGALAARPAWIIAKGGITSHDVAVRGLGMRRARVLGQLLPGLVSVFEPLTASPEARGVPYVVFAGNVGDDDTLAHVVSVLRSAQPARELAR
ncbi:four-carbon acid sugar kinase family protein [Lacisediminihabitans profunda]|uniref:Four-carbon acid sugar kinase family protein n=1 Tax=Lacisediminihabitans profunda TaxID=2594790 RepID=A0A5C8UQT4_9MICO|nr:four-carbon acid sugar kinase family protein [Lacisediminihabitans profunda]TXN30944.1 hypothetical protein FVP33_04900 [Lacisediminihabitans profunda]